MKKKVYPLLTLLPALLLVGCKTNSNNTTDDRNVVVEDFLDKTVDCYIGRSVSSITLRFFKENPNVPYIEPSTFLSKFYLVDTTCESNNSIYTYTSENHYISIDPSNDILTISDLDYFADIGPRLVTLYTPIKADPTTYVGGILPPMSYDLSEYGIHLYESESKAYVPLSTLSDCFSWTEGISVSYNEKDVYLVDGFNQYIPYAQLSNYSNYFSVIGDTSKQRNGDLIDFNYRELCFSIDKLNGHPAQVLIGKDNLDTYGLDYLLTNRFPEVKSLLNSKDRPKYVTGQYILFEILLYDGGHGHALYYPEENFDMNSYSSAVGNNSQTYELYLQCNADNNTRYTTKWNAASKARVAAFDNDQYANGRYNYWAWNTDNKIGLISFPSFYIDYSMWQDHYVNGEDVSEHSGDSLAFIYDTLKCFKENNIKNVVIDLTTNGGGDTYCLFSLISLITNKDSEFIVHDTAHNVDKIITYKYDSNFDGIFDENDCADEFDFKYAVLTSAASFSCANAFPMYLKDEGIMIMGEQSGGGSCCVGMLHTADGVPYRTSGIWKLINHDYIEHDFGVSVDVSLVTENDYSACFDLANLSSLMNDFYS